MIPSNPHVGSLGEIKKDERGNTYTDEDEGYASRFWFGDDIEKAKEFLKEFVVSFSFMMGESYLESLPDKSIEIVRGEYTIKVCYDLAQMRMNDRYVSF